MRVRDRNPGVPPLPMRGLRGFGYIGLLVIVALLGVALGGVGEIWRTAQKREKEQELLFVGAQFRRALEQFHRYTPGNARRHPTRLDELLLDPRHPSIRRYLRQVYRDPMTGSDEWGLVTGPNGEILGVYSRSEDAPLKRANFRVADEAFEGKTKYSQWVFMPRLP
jgi:type II secretory pathway pseudopilin PulG